MIFGRTSSVLTETTSAWQAAWYLANTRETYGIASIVPESDEAYYDCQPEAFISVWCIRTSVLTMIIATRTSNSNSAYRDICDEIDANNKKIKHKLGMHEGR